MRHAVALGIAVTTLTMDALAVDVPVGAKRVQIRAHDGREKLSFFSRDAGWTLPGLTGGTPGPVRIDVSSPAHPAPITLSVPPVAGRPGWSVSTDDVGTPRRYRFKNQRPPNGFTAVDSIVWSANGSFKLVIRDALLDPSVPQGGLRIRVTAGGDRRCARFDADTIANDIPGSFIARSAVADGLVDCSSAALGEPELPSCDLGAVNGTCTPGCPSDAVCFWQVFGNTCSCRGGTGLTCGSSTPMCNGWCPVGTHCGGSSGASGSASQCGCVPDETTACGDSGYPTCGGICPDPTDVCRPTRSSFSIAGTVIGCSCNDPGPCTGFTTCSPGADCPPGQACRRFANSFGCMAQCGPP